MKKKLSSAISIVVAISMLTSLCFSTNSNTEGLSNEDYSTNYLKGLNEESPSGNAWMEENLPKTKEVKINKIGLGRINKNLKEKGKDLLPESIAVEKGNEQEVLNKGQENKQSKCTTTGDLNYGQSKVQGEPTSKKRPTATPKPTATVTPTVAPTATPTASPTVDSITTPPSLLPAAVDNSTSQYFPPIRSQGSLGSCVCFATTYYQATYMNALANGLNVRDTLNTNKFSPKWTYNLINGGANAGSSYSSAYSVLRDNGVPSWNSMPYNSNYRQWSKDPAVWTEAIKNRTQAMGTLNYLDTDAGMNNLKQMITNGYILVFSTYFSSWQFKTVQNNPSSTLDDIYLGKKVGYYLNGASGGHAMTIVGYNDDIWTDINGNGVIDSGEKGAFRIANSWGATWGDKGFVWLAYDAMYATSRVVGGPTLNRSTGIRGYCAYWITMRNNYQPTLLAKFTVNTATRNQLNAYLGYSETTSNTPLKTLSNTALLNKGGAYDFDGGTIGVNATFVLDFTDLVSANNLMNGRTMRWYHLLNDNKTGSPITLTGVSLVNNLTGKEIGSPPDLYPKTADYSTVTNFIDYRIQ